MRIFIFIFCLFSTLSVKTDPESLALILKDFKEYNTKRDTLSYSTTRLSAHLNFGTISEREFYEKLKKTLDLLQRTLKDVMFFLILTKRFKREKYHCHYSVMDAEHTL